MGNEITIGDTVEVLDGMFIGKKVKVIALADRTTPKRIGTDATGGTTITWFQRHEIEIV